MTFATLETTIDLRGRDLHERHPLVFTTFRGIDAFESLEVVTDRDPQPLYDRLTLEQPDAFAWEVVEDGPANWRTRITKLAAEHELGRCCGSCGGT